MCTNVGFQAEFSYDSGYMPVLKSVTELDFYANWLNNANGFENMKALAVKVGIEARDTYYVSDAFNGSSAARNQVGYLLVKCISSKLDNGVSLEQFIKNAFEDAMDECLFQAG